MLLATEVSLKRVAFVANFAKLVVVGLFLRTKVARGGLACAGERLAPLRELFGLCGQRLAGRGLLVALAGHATNVLTESVDLLKVTARAATVAAARVRVRSGGAQEEVGGAGGRGGGVGGGELSL